MRKFILTLFVVVLLFSNAALFSHAGCVTKEDSIMYFEPDRFFKVARVCAANREQGETMMKVDVSEGDAVVIRGGTRVDEMKAIPDIPSACVVKIGNLLLVGLTAYIRCN